MHFSRVGVLLSEFVCACVLWIALEPDPSSSSHHLSLTVGGSFVVSYRTRSSASLGTDPVSLECFGKVFLLIVLRFLFSFRLRLYCETQAF